MDIYEELCRKLDVLRKNRESVPLEQLKTKYSVPYRKLQEDIQSLAHQILESVLKSGMVMLKEDFEVESEKLTERLQVIIDSRKDIFEKISKALYVNYDAMKAADHMVELKGIVYEKAYGPYFRKHCIVLEDGRIYNEINEMYWNKELELWMTEDGNSWTVQLPPTEENKNE